MGEEVGLGHFHGGLDVRVLVEVGNEIFFDERVHPIDRLAFAAFGEEARFFGVAHERFDGSPNVVDALAREGGASAHRRAPAFGGLGEEGEHAGEFGFFGQRAGDVVAVGLVHEYGVGNLDHAFFDALQFVALGGEQKKKEKVRHGAHHDFGLADADRFDEHGVKARRFAQEHRFAGFAGDTAERAAGRAGADKGVLFAREQFHAGLVAEHAAARDGAGRIDGQHRNLMPRLAQVHAEGLDKRAFAHPGNPRDAHAHGFARVGQQAHQEFLGRVKMGGGVALDEGNGAGQQGAVAGKHPVFIFGDGKLFSAGRHGASARDAVAGHAVVAAFDAAHDVRRKQLGVGSFRNPLGAHDFFLGHREQFTGLLKNTQPRSAFG